MAPDPQPLDRQIEATQIDILFGHAPFVLATTLLVAAALVMILWPAVPAGTLLTWWSALALIALLRAGLLVRYRRRSPASTRRWARYMTLATTLSGMVWGSAGVLFFTPDRPVQLIFMTIAIAGLTTGSTSSLAAWRPAQIGFAVSAMSPLAVRYLVSGGELWMVGLLCLLFLFNVLAFAHQVSQTITASIRLRFENQGLVDQLRAEKSIAEQARERAEEASLAKSKFLAAASHDLRQPLHAIHLFVEALRHGHEPTVVEHLGASAQALKELLDELLDISKFEAGLFKPQLRVFPLQELFDALERELRPVADEKGIELGFVPTRLLVRSDPNMLGRILRNIVTNAIRYTDDGAILVGCRRSGGRAALAVYDTGIGIAPEHHKAIFREFYQLGNPERDRRKGLGLGLAIVDGLCRLLEHPVSLASTPGRGSTFSILVPIVRGEPPQPDPVEEAPFDLRDRAVLVIDDEPTICLAMSQVLGRWGCRVLTAGSGPDADARLAETGFQPEAIIADYRLPQGRTGTEAIEAVRAALGRPVPAAILTGDTAPERLREASASGLLLLHKPVQPARLRATLTTLLAAPA